jgi:hypothetical protein
VQVFHRSTNVLSRFTIFGGLFVVAGLVYGLYLVNSSPYVTQQGIAKEQPIQFSHKHHAGLYQIDCQYCHSGTDRSPSAGVPPLELCMGCHSQFPASYDELEGIRTLKDHWQRKVPVEWVQIHRLPEYVQFQHQAHLRRGFACQTCHGPVQEMDKVSMTSDTKWWPWLLPTQKLEMGWCIQCHRANGASQDCVTCHY